MTSRRSSAPSPETIPHSPPHGETLNQQFPEQSAMCAGTPMAQHDRRVVVAFVLGVVALMALLITALLGSSPSSNDDEPGMRPAALSVTTASYDTL